MDNVNVQPMLPRVQGAQVGRWKIQSKLLWSFMGVIAFILLVIVITVLSQTYAQRTIDDLVQVHGRVARLSLDTQNTLRLMQRYEKDFLINYEKIGIKEAKELYLNPFIETGNQAYQTLYEIQQIETAQEDIDAVQLAMDSINEYLGAFLGTVEILEQRFDPETGELFKLEQSLASLGDAVTLAESPTVRNAYYLLRSAVQEYLTVPDRDKAGKVNEERATFASFIDQNVGLPQARENLRTALAEFDRWFVQVTNTDTIVAARITAYEEAARRVDPVIKSFLDYAVANEAQAITDMERTASLLLKVLIGVGLVSIALAVFIAIRLSRGLTNQVDHIMILLDEIGLGNFQARTPVVSTDELGVMASTLNAMLDNITTLIQSQEERDAIQRSIMKLLDEISALTEGDFTGRAEVTEDMTGAIADSFNVMADQFSDIISKVKIATQAVDETAAEVSTKTMTLAERNIEQVKGVTSAVEAIEEMVTSIRNVAENAQQSSRVSLESRKNAQAGADAVEETNRAMTEIREQINETARSIKRLGESSLEIGNIVKIIDDIADRTSILALNASIQAAMAGDAGHGFAVVADEVQRLADSSSNSTKQIELLVKSIQAEIKDLTTRIDESISKVVQGSKLADGAHDKLQEIEAVSSKLAELIEAITGATNNQVRMSETISGTMRDVGEVSRQSSLSAQDTAASMNVLSKTARELRSAVDIFKIGEAEMHHALDDHFDLAGDSGGDERVEIEHNAEKPQEEIEIEEIFRSSDEVAEALEESGDDLAAEKETAGGVDAPARMG